MGRKIVEFGFDLSIALEESKEIFHVHTHRCGHAAKEPVETLVMAALERGAERITFTDHCPFPGNPFESRMKDTELQEYLSELLELREKYQGKIEIRIGLEVEYLPEYKEYYKEVSEKVDILILGQHFFQITPGVYSPSNSKAADEDECYGLSNAIIEGICTGLFQVVAHPDRIFRKKQKWTEEMNQLSKKIICAALKMDVALEKNLASINRNQYREEFWNLVPEEAKIIVGVDAHSAKQIREASLKSSRMD